MGSAPLGKIKTFSEMRADNARRPSLIKGLVQSGSLYGLTGMTGHAKTTVSLYMALHISEGGFFGSHLHEVARTGTTVFIAGENPSNVIDQWHACCLAAGADPEQVKVVFIDERFDIKTQMQNLCDRLAEIEDLRLVVVDTLQAFFMGEDDNSNMAMVSFAQAWRPVTKLPSLPTVLINCHPAGKTLKDVKDKGIVPRGGGGFLGEIDANLSVLREEDQVTVHWAGKFRGKYPEPIMFDLVDRDFPELLDEDGEPMPMATLRLQSSMSRERKWTLRQRHMTQVLFRLDQNLPCGERALKEALDDIELRGIRELINEMIAKKLIARDEIGKKLRIQRKGKQELQRIKEDQEAENDE